MNYNNVSIVIPTFNRANYLVECIEACLKQTHSCEIIVCDHGSTDNTPEVAKSYGSKITYVRRELDSGVHFCWLDGILHAKNDLIHINFDDDWIEPTFIEKTINLFDDEVGCVFSNARVFYEDENRYTESLFFNHLTSGIHPSGILTKYNLTDLTSPCAGIFRKEIMINTLFQGRIPFTKNEYHGVGPDILFSLFSCKEYSKFGFVNENLTVFRAHKNSITIDALKDKEKQRKIKEAYNEARRFLYIYKIVEKFNIYKIASMILNKKQK